MAPGPLLASSLLSRNTIAAFMISALMDKFGKKSSRLGADEGGIYQLHSQQVTVSAAEPGLHIVATPIGNLGDITIRALETLAGCGFILCEDTRVSTRLLRRYGISRPLRAYHDHNADRLRPDILLKLRDGNTAALISDAGTPVISDPGYKLISACIEEGINVHTAPGVSAPIAALSLSGLPSDRFSFAGFAPAKSEQRRKFLKELAGNPSTLILFENPKRLLVLLADLADAIPDRQIVVARELTKRFEEILRGTAEQLIDQISNRENIKGEITVLIGPGSPVNHQVSEATLARAIANALAHQPASQAAAAVARQFGLKKKDVYARILAQKS